MGFAGVKLYPTYESNNATSFVTNDGATFVRMQVDQPRISATTT